MQNVFSFFELNSNYSNDAASDRDQESLEHIDDNIRNKKILCAATVLQAFLRKKPNEKVNYMGIINDFKL